MPAYDTLPFNSATAVENYYGATSEQATLASEFFAGYSGTGATLVFARYPELAVRAHLYGANISNLTLAQLQALNGCLTLSVDGSSYSGSVKSLRRRKFSGGGDRDSDRAQSEFAICGRHNGKFDHARIHDLCRVHRWLCVDCHLCSVGQHPSRFHS